MQGYYLNECNDICDISELDEGFSAEKTNCTCCDTEFNIIKIVQNETNEVFGEYCLYATLKELEAIL